MAILLQGLSKKYQNPVFTNLNLEFEENELVVFLGPSGCGKSTLLKILAKLETASSGKVTGLENKKSAVVFQEPRLLPWMSCLENVSLPLKIDSKSKAESETKALALLKKLNLESAQDFFPEALSGGMKMRTAIARSLIQEPQVLFMDEPFSALDEPTRFFLQEEFRKLYEQNKWSVFFVTHSIEEACFLANKIVIFQNQEKSQGVTPLIFEVPLPQARNKELRKDIRYFQVINELRTQIESSWKKDALK